MSKIEKKISFLNRYFVYKKIREVNIDNLHVELGEYEDAIEEKEKVETKKAVLVAKEEQLKSRPKVRKLSNKILLVNATEAIEEPTTKAIEDAIDKQDNKKTKGKKTNIDTKKNKKLIIIDSGDEKD
jgi:hypothetical protein